MKLFTKDFKENSKLIKSKLSESKESLIAKETLYALIPKRYQDVGLLALGQDVTVLAVFLLIDGKNNYTVINLPLKIVTEPSVIEDVTLDGVDYIRLTFFKDSLVLKSRKVLKDSSFIFDIVNDFNIKGKIPTFLTPVDITNLYIDAGKYLGSDIAANPIGIEIMLAINTRLKQDINTQARLSKKDLRKLTFRDYQYVGLGNVIYGLSTNIAKFTGRYYDDGLTSIILSPDQKQTDIENYYKL
jgi:hypothetical protein